MKKVPLRGRAFWERCVRMYETCIAAHGSNRQGYINYWHYRLGKPKAEAINQFEQDTQLLAACKQKAAAGHKPHRRTDKAHTKTQENLFYSI
jgi:hypothetical protein